MRILSYYQTTGTMLALVIMIIGTMADMLREITKCFWSLEKMKFERTCQPLIAPQSLTPIDLEVLHKNQTNLTSKQWDSVSPTMTTTMMTNDDNPYLNTACKYGYSNPLWPHLDVVEIGFSFLNTVYCCTLLVSMFDRLHNCSGRIKK